jgi:long-chain acyl-CoA synthetase
MLNLSILLEQSAKRNPSQNAMTFMDSVLTYAQLNGAANQVANAL